MNAVFKPIKQANSWSEVELGFFQLLELPPKPAAFQVIDAIATLDQASRSEFDPAAEAAWLQLQYWQRRLDNQPDPVINLLVQQETGFDTLQGLLNRWKPPKAIGQTKLADYTAKGKEQRQHLLASPSKQALATEIQQLQHTLDEIEAPYRKSHREINKIISDIRQQHGLTGLKLELEVEVSLFNQKVKRFAGDYETLKKEGQALQEKADYLQQMEDKYVEPIRNEWNNTKLYLPDDATRQQVLDTRQAINQKTEQLMSGVYEQLINQSAVSAETATTWAKQQAISPAVISRLKKNGYSKADLLKDMAEFYRLTHGRLPKVSLVTKGSDRAAADVAGNVVFIGDNFSKTTLFHEMAHLLENNPATKRMAQQFLESRSEGRPQPLRELTGNSHYRGNEVAYPDSFINPYVGKYYHDGCTEVMSMGLERFASPIKLHELLNKDPEMFDCMLGFLSGTPAVEQALYQQIQQQQATDHDFYQQLFKRVKPIKITEHSMVSGPFMDYSFRKARTRDPHTRRLKDGRIVSSPQGEREFMVSELDAKAWAYLHLLHQQGIQLQSIKHLKKLIQSRQAPEWFTSEMTLPALAA